jgi:hypothetical protein
MWIDNNGKSFGKSYRDCDLYIAIWNVLSLYRAEMLKQVKNELEE